MITEKINFSIKRSRRARRMRISVGCNSAVVVTLPSGLSFGAAERFVADKLNWIKKSLIYIQNRPQRIVLKNGKREYIKFKNQALQLAKQKVELWNKIYNFSYNRISIKNQKTRWGSCSKKGNLNFNYKIVHLPHPLLDYLIVHELCHLQEFNHSNKFWELVKEQIPEFKILRKQLRSFAYVQR